MLGIVPTVVFTQFSRNVVENASYSPGSESDMEKLVFEAKFSQIFAVRHKLILVGDRPTQIPGGVPP